MATVAERRFDDAEALSKTGQNARANCVAYLIGFVVEILLKAQLVRKFPDIAKKPQHRVADSEREVWRLIWKAHDLDGMLLQMVELEGALKVRGTRDGKDYLENLKKICATWTIQSRYSTHTIQMPEASRLLDMVRSLKEVLK
jgi:hypothetical protein